MLTKIARLRTKGDDRRYEPVQIKTIRFER
jgi:hypothetical protein